MKYFAVLFLFLSVFLFSSHVNGQEQSDIITFKAKVLSIIREETKTRENGSVFRQQNLRLKGLEGKWKDKEFTYTGITEYEVVDANSYSVGDKVLVNYSVDSNGQDIYYITDYVRSGYVYILVAFFCLIVILIARFKGIKSLVSLFISFIIIMKLIIPKILSGMNPLLIGVFGSAMILLLIIYITEGFHKKSHIAILSIAVTLTITYFLSSIFTSLTKLTGLAQEEVLFLIGNTQHGIDFHSLLLTGILIGTLGVLDDVSLSQIEAVLQIKKANPYLSRKKVFSMAITIGKTHVGSMINTLFLAYTGAALPLLLLFSLKQPPFLTFSQVINYELIATEFVRTFIGSIGITLAMPISTYLAVKFFIARHDEKNEKTS